MLGRDYFCFFNNFCGSASNETAICVLRSPTPSTSKSINRHMTGITCAVADERTLEMSPFDANESINIFPKIHRTTLDDVESRLLKASLTSPNLYLYQTLLDKKEFIEQIGVAGSVPLSALSDSEVKAMVCESMRSSIEQFGPSFFEQIELESMALNRETKRIQKLTQNLSKVKRASELSSVQGLLVSWYNPLLERLKLDKVKLSKSEHSSDMLIILEKITLEKLVVLTMHTVVSHLIKNTHGASFLALVNTLADVVSAQFNYEYMISVAGNLWCFRSFKEKSQNYSSLRKQSYKVSYLLEKKAELSSLDDSLVGNLSSGTNVGSANHMSYLSRLRDEGMNFHSITQVKDGGSSGNYLSLPCWNNSLKRAIGTFLIEPFLDVATFCLGDIGGRASQSRRERPAFERVFSGAKSKSLVRLSTLILDHISLEQFVSDLKCIRYYPMLIKPKPWAAPNNGAYYLHPTTVIRYYDFKNQMAPLFNMDEHLRDLYRALDVLSSTEWILNMDVYRVVKEAWELGGGIAELPSRKDFPLPVPGPEGKTRSWYLQTKRIERENANMHSLRCDFLLKIQVAELFMSRKMYFPHNLDFRGRAYPIPPHLNHMGSDLSRGLLKFAEGRPLGSTGLYWLKVQLSNLYGNDKISFEDRVEWTNSHTNDIFDCVDNTLNGEKFWLGAEDPFQFLAACFELVSALRHKDGAENYISHLPIHMDGTCNGLQHYAALGGDEKGAISVNLIPGDRPQDIYSDVTELVNSYVDSDAANGLEVAIMLKGKVSRKVVKQTVMTSVYGVTFVGARQQIHNALKERGILAEDDRFKASLYLSTATFNSIREMFAGAKMIMNWFSTCASLIARKNRLVSWITPLGLPAVQPYKKENQKKNIKTAFQTLSLENKLDRHVSTRKQASAFPPNYVHSLDSTHMLLTALACHRRGIVFSSVHDSYWCHACNVNDMNAILRQSFVDLHSKPLLEQLLFHFRNQNPDIEFPQIPPKGHLDLNHVLRSKYFFN